MTGVIVLRRVAVGRPRWQRTNFRGTTVSLTAGPAVAAGALAGAAGAGVPGALLCGGAAGALGLYDDLYGDTHARGLGGHARALAQGRVTTGLVKLAGLVTAGAASSVLGGRRGVRVGADAALVAGTANLVNLLDLRPGRALKAVGTVGAVMAVAMPRADLAPAAGVAACCVGVAAAAMPSDLAERAMIGDCGANALGAMLGWTMASGLPTTGRRIALAAVIALTLASERVSFTGLIESTPWLRVLDEWGRAA